MMPIQFKVVLILIGVGLIPVEGASLWDKFVPSGVKNIWKMADLVTFKSDSPISDVILHLVEELRDGLIKSQGEHLPIPDFNWNVKSPSLNGVVRTTSMLFTGLTKYDVNRLNTSVINRTVDLDVSIPFMNLHGDFVADGSCAGFPVWGSGQFSIKLIKPRAEAGAQLMGDMSTVRASTPRLSVQQIDVTMDGFYDNILGWHVLLIFIGIVIFVVLISIFITLRISRFNEELLIRKGSYRQVE